MIRSSVYTPTAFNGQPAGAMWRASAASMCMQLDGANYQAKQDRQRDFEIDI